MNELIKDYIMLLNKIISYLTLGKTLYFLMVQLSHL